MDGVIGCGLLFAIDGFKRKVNILFVVSGV